MKFQPRLVCVLLVAVLAAAAVPAHAWLANGTPLCIDPSDQLQLVTQSDGTGGAYLAWTDARTGTYLIYALHIDPNGNPVAGWPFNGLAISPSVTNQTEPAIAVSASGTFEVAWHEGPKLRLAHANAAGAVAADTVAQGLVFAGDSHQIAFDTNGFVWLAQSPHSAGSGVVVVRQGWAARKTLVSNNTNLGATTLVPDATGGAWIAWVSYGIGRTDLLGAHVTASGAYAPGSSPAGDTLCSANGAPDGLVSVSDGAGGVYHAWIDRRSSNADVYATRLLANGALAAGWALNGTPVCTAANAQTDVHVVRDAGGGLFLAWDDQRAGPDNDDIDASALASNGQRRAGFPVNGLAVATGASTQIQPAIAAHPDGTATIAWAGLSAGLKGFDIFAARLSQHGGLTPGVNGTGASTFNGDQLQPLLVPGPGTDALVFWTDSRDLQNDVYGTRLAFAAPAAVDEADEPRFVITRVWPQPAHEGRVSVRLTLPDERAATLALYDVAGRRAGTVRTIAGAGVHDVTLDTAGAVPGLYFVRVQLGSEQREAKAVLAR